MESTNLPTVLISNIMINVMTVYLVVMASFTGICNAEGSIEEARELQLKSESKIRTAFVNLDERQPKDTIARNLQIIFEGREVSLKVLMNELDNSTIAHSSFEGTENVSFNRENGGVIFNKVTLGDVALDIIKFMVEGKIPIFYAKYFLLTKGNAKLWLETRKGKTLEELQIDAVTENLRNAEKLDSSLHSEFSQGLVDYFKKRSVLLKHPSK